MAEAANEFVPTRIGVDNYNWEIVKEELPCPSLKRLLLICRENAASEIPTDEVAALVSNLNLDARFIDSLYSAGNPKKDAARLQPFLSGEGIKLVKFFGHLDEAGLALLPHSVSELSLAIGNEADMNALCALELWDDLFELRLSLCPTAKVEDLKAMPRVKQRALFFPYLTDDRVDFVMTSIRKVVPQLRLTGLYFPKSKLTSEGAKMLALRIRSFIGLRVDFYIILEPSGEWQPDEAEKAKLKAQFGKKSALNMVSFSMSWLFEDPCIFRSVTN